MAPREPDAGAQAGTGGFDSDPANYAETTGPTVVGSFIQSRDGQVYRVHSLSRDANHRPMFEAATAAGRSRRFAAGYFTLLRPLDPNNERPAGMSAATWDKAQRNLAHNRKVDEQRASAEVLSGRGKPDGTGTADDPIDVKGDLDRAVDLLTEGKHVRLNQPDEVSTLIGKLGKIVRDARESGGTAPTIDLCQVTVAGTNLFCVGNKGHRRIDMPQLEGTALPGTTADTLERNAKGFVDVSGHFRQALEDAGVTVTTRTRPANRLRATQREMNAGIVARIAGEIEQGRTDDPIYVTRDGYIIDGHHVWAANVAVDAKDNRLGDVQVPVNEIDMDIGAALDFARRFAKDVGVESASVSVPANRATAT